MPAVWTPPSNYCTVISGGFRVVESPSPIGLDQSLRSADDRLNGIPLSARLKKTVSEARLFDQKQID